MVPRNSRRERETKKIINGTVKKETIFFLESINIGIAGTMAALLGTAVPHWLTLLLLALQPCFGGQTTLIPSVLPPKRDRGPERVIPSIPSVPSDSTETTAVPGNRHYLTSTSTTALCSYVASVAGFISLLTNCGGSSTHVWHGRSRMTLDSRIPTMPGEGGDLGLASARSIKPVD